MSNRVRLKSAFPIVGVGASAGGLKAFTQLLEALTTTTGMAFVLVQHLDPKHKSGLVELLARKTELPVEEIKNGHKIQPNHVYVIPENAEITIKNAKLQVHSRRLSTQPHLPIDRFLTSLAHDQQTNAIGVILSGALNDGTQGLQAIKAAGGVTFAQDESASTSGMPQSAIIAGVADFTLPPAKIAAALQKISKQHSIKQSKPELKLELATETTEFNKILALLERQSGVNMTAYKTATLHRRINRRLMLLNLHNLAEYASHLEDNPAEVSALYQDTLINVTSFFRDQPALDVLKKQLLPELTKTASTEEPIRIWVAGCASGEEAYSFAIVCREFLDKQHKKVPIKIFATDLSAPAIAQARSGLYPSSSLIGVPQQHKDQYFITTSNGYRVKESIREMCVFAAHNLLSDPAFSKMDIVACCNVLIYLQSPAQQRLLRSFHYALKPNGYLVLGISESVGAARTLFSAIDKKHKIYSRKSVSSSYKFESMRSNKQQDLVALPPRTPESSLGEFDVTKLADTLLLNQYAPASVVIDSDMEIVQFHGTTSPYLEPAQGKASLNLLKMAQPGLALYLRKAIREVEENRKSYSTVVIIRKGKTNHSIKLEVTPLATGKNADSYYLVVFKDVDIVNSQETSQISAPRANKKLKTDDDNAKDRQMFQLDRELAELQDEMRRLGEEQETTNEELQLANEEARSSNEELQSSNEELETSGEELASSNEELTSTNQMLRANAEELASARDYAEAIIATVREPLIILAPDLKVISANDSFYQTFKVAHKDTEDKSIHTLGDGQWDIPELHEMLKNITTKEDHFQNYAVSHDFLGIGQKIMLLNARLIRGVGNNGHLILLAIEDITQRHIAEEALKVSEQRLRFMAESMPQKIFTATPTGAIDYFNPQWLEFTGLSFEKIRDWGWTQLIHPDDLNETVRLWKQAMKTGKPFEMEHRFRRTDGQYLWHISRARALCNTDGNISLWIASNTDIDDLKRSKKRTIELEQVTTKLKHQRNQLVTLSKSKDEFINLAAHQLRTPATGVKQYVGMLLEGYVGEVTSQQREFLDQANESNERQLRIIDDLLKVAQVDSGQMLLGTMSVDLVPLIKSVIEEQATQFSDLRQRVHFKHKASTVIALVDLDKIRMVFENLIDNASKYTHADKQITITLTQSKKEVKIAIKDEGVGIEVKNIRQLFKKFSRIDNDMSVLVGGTGLGLYWSKKIVELHGGSISVTSVFGKGSTFTVIIPMNVSKKQAG